LIISWLEELIKGMISLFLNPVFYWSFILVFLVGYKRVKSERQQFNSKIFDIFSESKRMLASGLGIGLLISLVLIGTGIVFSYGSLLTISIMMIILSLSLRFTMLSPSYTIGFSFILLLFMPNLLDNQQIIDQRLFADINFTGLVFLLGMLLIAEAFLMRRTRRNETFPRLTKSERGVWVGEHHMSKMTVIPLFMLVPGGVIESFAPYWPLLSLGEQSYGLLLFPFLIGFSHRIRSTLATIAARQLAKRISILGLFVMMIAACAYFIPELSLVALLLGVIGREWITYRFRLHEKRELSFFRPQDKGLRILGIIPGTPADRLDLQVGEQIMKVNEKRVSEVNELYQALQGTGASFKLEVLDDNEEVRFVQSALYESDHYRLGLLFVEPPHRLKKTLDKSEEQEQASS